MVTCRHICVCVCVCVYGWCYEPERGGKVHSSVVSIFFFYPKLQSIRYRESPVEKDQAKQTITTNIFNSRRESKWTGSIYIGCFTRGLVVFHNNAPDIQKWASKFLSFFWGIPLPVYPPPPPPPPPPPLWDDINEHKYQCSLNTMDTCSAGIYVCVCMDDAMNQNEAVKFIALLSVFFFFLSETSINMISRVASRTQLWRSKTNNNNKYLQFTSRVKVDRINLHWLCFTRGLVVFHNTAPDIHSFVLTLQNMLA